MRTQLHTIHIDVRYIHTSDHSDLIAISSPVSTPSSRDLGRAPASSRRGSATARALGPRVEQGTYGARGSHTHAKLNLRLGLAAARARARGRVTSDAMVTSGIAAWYRCFRIRFSASVLRCPACSALWPWVKIHAGRRGSCGSWVQMCVCVRPELDWARGGGPGPGILGSISTSIWCGLRDMNMDAGVDLGLAARRGGRARACDMQEGPRERAVVCIWLRWCRHSRTVWNGYASAWVWGSCGGVGKPGSWKVEAAVRCCWQGHKARNVNLNLDVDMGAVVNGNKDIDVGGLRALAWGQGRVTAQARCGQESKRCNMRPDPVAACRAANMQICADWDPEEARLTV
ncbi:hypothetical protein DENSPDRAFT_851797 [Dentipellis sp. KUC8613]|nr:hypothetical protein DENSPDRAFT_851797 [Dentipellis sp. KUC8613]